MLSPNTILQGRYRIIRHLGHGGMGAVYEALNERVSSIVALKETFAETEAQREAFEQEAKRLANLDHDAFPKVMDHFFEGDGQYLVMELVRGNDLAELLKLRESPFSPAKVLEWADQLLDALEELHSYPIIHRDIKPSNLKLTRKGKIKLLDFGIAKGAVGQMTTLKTDQSGGGYTPHYAPLEQTLRSSGHWSETLSILDTEAVERIGQKSTDPRSDLYALGATLYHLMTGLMPPDAPTRALSVWTGRPDRLRPAHEVNPQVPLAVSAVLMQAMSLERDQRPNSAAELRRMFREAVNEPLSVPPTGIAPEIEEQARKVREAEARRRAEADAQKQHEAEEAARRAEGDARRRREAEARQRQEEEERKREAERAEAAQRVEEEQRRLRQEEERRLAEAEAARRRREAEEQQRQEEEERKREAERAEAQQRAEEEQRSLRQEEERRLAEAEAARRAAEEQQRVEKERRLREAEEKQRQEAEAAAKLRAEEERDRLELARRQEEQQARLEAEELERRRAAERKVRARTEPAGEQPGALDPPTIRTIPALGLAAPPHRGHATRDVVIAGPPRNGKSKRTMLIVIIACVTVLAVVALIWMRQTPDDRQKPAEQDIAQSPASAPPTTASAPQPPAGMVYVPGGEFMMGRDDDDEYERPAHKVTVKPFFIDIYEVTNEEYMKFVRETDWLPPTTWANENYSPGAGRKPVTGVTWDDASAYAKWAGKRLPTEEEWEFAARGTEGRRYAWGNEWRKGLANANGESTGIVEVGTFAGASAFGVYDMIGNAWEWTASRLSAYPRGRLPESPPADAKVIRGGNFKSSIKEATTTYRMGLLRTNDPSAYTTTGVRCVKDVN